MPRAIYFLLFIIVSFFISAFNLKVYLNSEVNLKSFNLKGKVHVLVDSVKKSKYDFNKDGQLVSQYNVDLTNQGKPWFIKKINYGKNGKMKTVKTFRDNQALSTQINYFYDKKNRIKEEKYFSTNPNSYVVKSSTLYKYMKKGRIKIRTTNICDTVSSVVVFRYDRKGNLKEIDEGERSEKYYYSQENKLIQENQYNGKYQNYKLKLDYNIKENSITLYVLTVARININQLLKSYTIVTTT